jgi:hypothetical protein
MLSAKILIMINIILSNNEGEEKLKIGNIDVIPDVLYIKKMENREEKCYQYIFRRKFGQIKREGVGMSTMDITLIYDFAAIVSDCA